MIFRRQRPAPPPIPMDSQGIDDAHQALDDALNQWPAIRDTVNEMRRIRRENHLAEKVHRALGGNA
jgi:hypothetical protein